MRLPYGGLFAYLCVSESLDRTYPPPYALDIRETTSVGHRHAPQSTVSQHTLYIGQYQTNLLNLNPQGGYDGI